MTFERDNTVESATRLAELLADTRGAEVLAEVQKLNQDRWASTRRPSKSAADDTSSEQKIAIWNIEHTPDGVALRRPDGADDWWRWADVDYVAPPAGARRVVLVGESAARGWLLDPSFNPIGVLREHLAAEPTPYQCVDLARSNIDLDMLHGVVEDLPLIEPDVVVFFAGNNFTFGPIDDSYRDNLAEALRAGGYAAMRHRYIDYVVLPRVDRLIERLEHVRTKYGTEVIVVVPETNLRGWEPTPQIEVPSLPKETLAQWYALYDDARSARDVEDWPRIRDLATKMSALDGGLSAVSWYLQGQSAMALGDGRAARRLLEQARDAVVGLLVDHVPGVFTGVRERLVRYAQEAGVPCVDLAEVLASEDMPDLPDARFFLDNCHVTDEAIERVMSRVSDAVLAKPEGTTQPGDGAPAAIRAVGHALAAGYCALRDQPRNVVHQQLHMALAADEQATGDFIGAFLDVLESPAIRWSQPALGSLLSNPQAVQLCVHIAQTRSHTRGFWMFREAAQDMLGRMPTAHRCGWRTVDLLAFADARGFRAPNYAAGKAYFDATARKTTFAVAQHEAKGGRIRLTYRLPGQDLSTATVDVNGVRVGELAPAQHWSTVTIDVPADVIRVGINWIDIQWPVTDNDDAAQRESDANALARRSFPRVLPVFGSLYDAHFDVTGVSAESGRFMAKGFASRTSSSTGWYVRDADGDLAAAEPR